MRIELLLVVGLLCSLVSSATVDSVKQGEFDIIYLDHPGWVHALHHNPITNTFYAFGDGNFRQVNHEAGVFQAVDNFTLDEYNHPFVDLRIFATPGTSDMWMIGPTYSSYGGANPTATNIGYFMPLSYAGPPPRNYASLQGVYRGYTFFAVSVDARNYPKVLAYFVGWAQGPFADVPADSVGFVVTRAHIDLSQPPAGRHFEWNPEGGDMVSLSVDGYRPYHSTYRPTIIHDYNANLLYVIDPASANLYIVHAPADGTSPISQNGGKFDFSAYGRLAGLNWQYFQEVLYMGFTVDGSGNGTLLALELPGFEIKFKYTFDGYHSNPRAIAGAPNSTFLYIGFEGGPSILKFDTVNVKVVGSARLPEQLNQVYSAWDAGFSHIYFSTWEQHSKVFRLHKDDFCSGGCAYNAYCVTGVCQCPSGQTLNSQRNLCETPAPAPIKEDDDKAAAIALGVLWGITLIAGVIGWVLYIRKSKGYERVL